MAKGTKPELNGQTESNESDFDKIMAAVAANDYEALNALEQEEQDEVEDVNDEAEENVNKDEIQDDPEDTQETGLNSAAEGEDPNAAEAPLDYKAENERLLQEVHRYKSDAGRVPNLQRRLAELEKELRAKPTPAARNPEPQVSEATSKLPPELQQKLDALREIDPDLATILEAIRDNSQQGAIQYTEQQLRQMEEEREELQARAFYDEQLQQLEQAVPDAMKIFSMPQWPEWKAGLTPGQRAMTESGYASDMVIAINAYKHYLQQTGQLQNPQAPVAQPTAEELEAKKVQEARARRQDTAVNSKGTPAKREEPFDENKFFAEMYEKIGKETHILK